MTMLQAASSTAWTRSSVANGPAPNSAAASRTNDRSAANSLTAPVSRIDRVRAPAVISGSGQPREVGRRTLDEPTGALAPGERPIADDDGAPAHDDVAAALDGAALVAGVVDRHVVRLRRDRVLAARVVDDEVGVRTDRDRTLSRIHPEQLRRRGGGDLDPALLRDPSSDDAAVVEQVHPVLDAGQAVRDLPEVALPEVFLAVE